MSHGNGPLIAPEVVEAAIAKVLELRRVAPNAPLHLHIGQAMSEAILGMLGDETERGRATLQTAMLEEVGRGVGLRLKLEQYEADDEAVDAASDQSFPASDPPSWIWRARRAGD